MTERLLIVWPPMASTSQGDLFNLGQRFAGGWPDGRANSGAVFAHTEDGWKCVRAGRWLEWFVGGAVENLKIWLTGPAAKRGWRYQWATVFEIPS